MLRPNLERCIGKLEIERKKVLEGIEELKLFEADYREQLRRYIEDQLDQLTREGTAATGRSGRSKSAPSSLFCCIRRFDSARKLTIPRVSRQLRAEPGNY